ncbi:MAG: hypothetical protein OSB83_13200, partial [Planctomycetota bacterium]|nr:hypothetical protein [Planctomycetota bacterium]
MVSGQGEYSPDDYLREFLVLGSFKSQRLSDKLDFSEAVVTSIAGLAPEEGKKVAVSDEETLTWTKFKTESPVIDFIEAVGPTRNATAYAYTEIESKESREVTFHFRSDDEAAVWLNGKFIHSFEGNRPISRDLDLFNATLKTGTNRLLFKIRNQGGTFGMSARMTDPVESIENSTLLFSGKVTLSNNEVAEKYGMSIWRGTKLLWNGAVGDTGPINQQITAGDGPFDVQLWNGESRQGTWLLGLNPAEGNTQVFEGVIKIDAQLEERSAISGHVVMMDGHTPHTALATQLISLDEKTGEEKIAHWGFTNKHGYFNFVNPRPGNWMLRFQVPGGHAYYVDRRVTSSDPKKAHIFKVSLGEETINQKGLEIRIAPFFRGNWKHFLAVDGLNHQRVQNITIAREGDQEIIYFPTDGGGVTAYNGERFAPLNTIEPLGTPDCHSVGIGGDGKRWVRAKNGTIVTLHNGKYSEPLRPNPKMGSYSLYDIGEQDKDVVLLRDSKNRLGYLSHEGFRFVDGKIINSHVNRSKVAPAYLSTFHLADDGILWLGSWAEGLIKCEEEYITRYSLAQSGPESVVKRIESDNDCNLWIATDKAGLFQLDGANDLTFYGHQQGLPHHDIKAIRRAPGGGVWIATHTAATLFDGTSFLNVQPGEELL